MSLFGKLVGGAVKTALTPMAVVADVIDTATGNEPKNTKKHIDSIVKDAEDILDGDID